MNSTEIKRAQATLVGCAIGDTLGMPVEGWKKGRIEKYVGRITEPIEAIVITDGHGNIVERDEWGKIYHFGRGLKRGQYTDDTILTVALAESLVEKKGVDLADIAEKHIAAYRAHRSFGGFGKTTAIAIQQLEKGVSPQESGTLQGPGNGPAMKMSPLGIYLAEQKHMKEAMQAARNVGRITHLDSRSVASGCVQVFAVASVILGASKRAFLENIVDICSYHEEPLVEGCKAPEKGTLLQRLQWIKEHANASCDLAYETLGNSGFVLESYPFALFMFQKYWDSPLEGLLETVNYGGDCDTTGAIYGALSGALHGMFFPAGWLEILEDRERLMKLGEALVTTFSMNGQKA